MKLVKKKNKNFTVLSNVMFHDHRLNAKDRGVLATMLSYPDGWKFSIKRLAKDFPDGETAIANSLRRIEKAHYLKRRRIYKDGKIVDWEYIISDEPMEEDNDGKSDKSAKSAKSTKSSKSAGKNVESVESVETVETVDKSEKETFFVPSLDDENLDVENQDVENLDLENPDNYKLTIKKESINKETANKESINHSAKSESLGQNFQHKTRKKNDRIDKSNKRSEINDAKRAATEEIVKSNIEYEWYKDFFDETPDNSENVGYETFAASIEDIDMILEVIVSTICSEKDYIRISGSNMSHSVVESRFMKLKMEHIEYALKGLVSSETKVKNPVAYLTTVLYNASFTANYADANDMRSTDPFLFKPKYFQERQARPYT